MTCLIFFTYRLWAPGGIKGQHLFKTTKAPLLLLSALPRLIACTIACEYTVHFGLECRNTYNREDMNICYILLNHLSFLNLNKPKTGQVEKVWNFHLSVFKRPFKIRQLNIPLSVQNIFKIRHAKWPLEGMSLTGPALWLQPISTHIEVNTA